MSTNIARARAQAVFVVPETTRGTLAYPAYADRNKLIVQCAGYATMNQNPTFTDSEEVLDSLDVMDRFRDKTPAGQFMIPMYLRPSGTAGSIPMGAALFTALMGVETINADTSVVYSLAQEKPTVSVWMKCDHTIFFASGAAVTDGKHAGAVKGAVKFDFSGSFMKMGWAGTDTLATGITGASITSVVVDDAKKFSVGARIYNATKNLHNSNQGWAVTAVNVDTNTLTVSPAIDGSGTPWEVADVIAGYLPTGTPIGDAVEARKESATIGGVSKVLKAMDLTISCPVQMIEDEMDASSDYPTDFVENVRSISGSLGMYFRKADADLFYEGMQGSKKAIAVTIGNTAGKTVVFTMSRASLEVPQRNINAPTVDLSIGFKALGTSGEDSATITFQ